jgi:hypothetical protein
MRQNSILDVSSQNSELFCRTLHSPVKNMTSDDSRAAMEGEEEKKKQQTGITAPDSTPLLLQGTSRFYQL